MRINSSNAELNPICLILALLGAHHILHVGRITFKEVRNPTGNIPVITHLPVRQA